MKKCLMLASFALMSLTVYAQKTVITTRNFSDTQARMLEVTATSYVRPLVVDLTVQRGQQRKLFTKNYSKVDFEVAMGANLDNLRSRAIYDASEQWGCDAIVAATFKIEYNESDQVYMLEMKGFPANFDPDSWHSMDDKDFKWIEVDRSARSFNENRAGAVITNIKK